MLNSFTSPILTGLLIWSVAFPLILILRRWLRLPGTGLDISYLASFFIGHAPGAFIYVLPWYFTYYDGYVVQKGFELSWIGALAFTGALLVGTLLWGGYKRSTISPPIYQHFNNPRLPWLLFGIGIASYLIVAPVAGQVASLTAVVSNLGSLQVIGIIVGIWQGLTTKQPRQVLLWLMLSLLLPVTTLIVGGFLGYGIVSLLTIGAFLASRIRPQWWHLPIVFLAVYFGISLFITYYSGRTAIREVVWGGESYEERFEVVGIEFNEWQWFDWRNQTHLTHIDGRLNQNFLVGAARNNLESRLIPYAGGETLKNAALGFIPRIIWREKPVMAGGSAIVTNYTFVEFATDTSVAAGQVMEFFINFGMTGVIVGFGLLGLVFAALDRLSAISLDTDNIYGFVRWYLIGMALVKPTDDFTVMTAGAAGAIVTAFLVEQFLKWWFARQAPRTVVPSSIPALVPPRR